MQYEGQTIHLSFLFVCMHFSIICFITRSVTFSSASGLTPYKTKNKYTAKHTLITILTKQLRQNMQKVNTLLSIPARYK